MHPYGVMVSDPPGHVLPGMFRRTRWWEVPDAGGRSDLVVATAFN